ncbi:MAG: elongation factor 1-beta [Candidatus Odinarchaeota archaeon]|nr:elongation factor 1-beta [Candidatus Odinarchaeota archaeon]
MPSEVLAQIDVLPNDISLNLDELKKKIEEKLPEGVRIHSYRIIPIAFGLSKLRLNVIMPHSEGSTDRIEEIIKSVDGVDDVEVGAVSLYH